MKATNKFNTVTFLQVIDRYYNYTWKQILDFVLKNRTFGNVVTRNQNIYMLWSIDKNIW